MKAKRKALRFILWAIAFQRGRLVCLPDAALRSCVAGIGERVLRLFGPAPLALARRGAVGVRGDGFLPVFVFIGRIVSASPRRASRLFEPRPSACLPAPRRARGRGARAGSTRTA